MDGIREVKLEDMLAAREARAHRIACARKEQPHPIVSFTMNIPGPIKVTPLIRRGFHEGRRRLESALRAAPLPFSCLYCGETFTGCEALYTVEGEETALKRLCIELENADGLSRLFDLDVIGTDGSPVSRTVLGFEERGCMVCGAAGRGCASRRIHDADALRQAAEDRLGGFFDPHDRACIAALAAQSLVYEVNVTPKPGLVDRGNNGSHRDMDPALFERSAAALAPFFGECFAVGRETAHGSPEETFRRLRGTGLAAEQAMFAATGGVNTHKGAIFLLGTLCGAVGRLRNSAYPRPSAEALLRECGRMTADAMAAEFERIRLRGSSTAGEALYLDCGLRGARGEAADGFPSVRNVSLPVFRSVYERTGSAEHAAVTALLHLIALGDDTNMFHRGGADGAVWGAEQARSLVADDRIPEIAEVEELDRRFIERNLSPGGCADLLAVTLFLHRWETEKE